MIRPRVVDRVLIRVRSLYAMLLAKNGSPEPPLPPGTIRGAINEARASAIGAQAAYIESAHRGAVAADEVIRLLRRAGPR